LPPHEVGRWPKLGAQSEPPCQAPTQSRLAVEHVRGTSRGDLSASPKGAHFMPDWLKNTAARQMMHGSTVLRDAIHRDALTVRFDHRALRGPFIQDLWLAATTSW